MPTLQAKARPPRYLSRAAGVWIAVALICGLGGGIVGEDVVGALGRLVDHDEFLLRLLGWCWGGLPYVLVAVAFFVRRRLVRARAVLVSVLAAWCASVALLLPGRGSSLEHRFGSAYPDARVLGFASACGILPVFASLFLTLIVVLVAHKIFGRPAKERVDKLTAGLFIAWSLLTAAGLVAAFVGPLP